MRRVERLTAKRPWETLGMSYRVARIYDRLGQEQGRGQGDPWAWSGVARPTLTSYRSEKAGDFAPGQGGQGGHGGSTAPSGETRRHAFASDGAPPVKAMPAISHTSHHKYPDHPDHVDQASELKGLSGQGSLTETAPTLTGPPWPDLDILRRAYGEARGVEAKRAMVAAWAAAAGGLVTGGVLRLPRDLPKGTAATAGFLMIYARCVGLVVGEPLERLCAWCPNPPPRDDTLCDHCRWLAGARP